VDEAQRGREEKEGGGIGSRGRGGVLGVGDDNGWGPNDRAADAPPSRFREGGPLPPPERIQRRVSLLRYLGLRSLTPLHTFIFVERWKWKEAEEEDQRTQEKESKEKDIAKQRSCSTIKKGTKKENLKKKFSSKTGLPGHPTRLSIVQMTGPIPQPSSVQYASSAKMHQHQYASSARM